MKKFLFLISLLAVSAVTFGQVKDYYNPINNTKVPRLIAEKTLFIPTGCGAPTGTSSLSSDSSNRAAKYFDSCHGKEYTFDPKTKTWSISGSGGNAGNSDSLNHQLASYYQSRANHTGTQSITSISGLQSALDSNTKKTNNLSDLTSPSSARSNLGIGNVNNTSDLSKPVSTAQQTALDGKVNLSDTASMLTGYPRVLRFLDSLSAVQSRIQSKQPSGSYLSAGNNLADVTNIATARSNISAIGIADTANMLSGYIRSGNGYISDILNTSANGVTINSTGGTTPNLIASLQDITPTSIVASGGITALFVKGNGKPLTNVIHPSDTASMLIGYARSGNIDLSTVVKYLDTSNLLTGYQRSGNPLTTAAQPNITSLGNLSNLTVSGFTSSGSSYVGGQLNTGGIHSRGTIYGDGYLSIVSAAYLTGGLNLGVSLGYQKTGRSLYIDNSTGEVTQAEAGVSYTDTASMLSGYAKVGQVVKYSDTASMVSNLLRKTDTAAMLAPHVTKYWQDSIAILKSNIGGDVVSGLRLENPTTPSLNNRQNTPAVTIKGSHWRTGAGGVSVPFEWRYFGLSAQSVNPTNVNSNWYYQQTRINGGAWVNVYKLNGNGNLSTYGTLNVMGNVMTIGTGDTARTDLTHIDLVNQVNGLFNINMSNNGAAWSGTPILFDSLGNITIASSYGTYKNLKLDLSAVTGSTKSLVWPNEADTLATRAYIKTTTQVGTLNSLTVAGSATAKDFYATSSTPSVAAGASAGSSPTLSIGGTNENFSVTLQPGTSPTGSGVLFTVTFSNSFAFPHGCNPVFSPGNSQSALLSGTTMIYSIGSTTTVTVYAGSTALTNGTNYTWNFSTGGY